MFEPIRNIVHIALLACVTHTLASHSDSSYEPIALVRQMHRLPHLTMRLEPHDHEFDIDYDSQWNSYTQSLLPLPIIIASVGYVLLLALLGWMMCRLGIDCCRCAPSKLGNSFFNGVRVVHPAAKYLRYLVFLGLLGLLLWPQVMIMGSGKLSDGVNTIKDGLDFLSDTFNDLTNYGERMEGDGILLLEQFSSAAENDCFAARGLEQYVDDYLDYVDDYLSYVEPVPDKVDNVHDEVDKYGINWKNDSIYAAYACILLSAILLFGSAVVKKPSCFMGMSVAFTQIVVALVIFLCMILMIVLVRFKASNYR